MKSEEDKAKLSLRPVAERLSELLEKPVTFVPETRGEKLEAAINAPKAMFIIQYSFSKI